MLMRYILRLRWAERLFSPAWKTQHTKSPDWKCVNELLSIASCTVSLTHRLFCSSVSSPLFPHSVPGLYLLYYLFLLFSRHCHLPLSTSSASLLLRLPLWVLLLQCLWLLRLLLQWCSWPHRSLWPALWPECRRAVSRHGYENACVSVCQRIFTHVNDKTHCLAQVSKSTHLTFRSRLSHPPSQIWSAKIMLWHTCLINVLMTHIWTLEKSRSCFT